MGYEAKEMKSKRPRDVFSSRTRQKTFFCETQIHFEIESKRISEKALATFILLLCHLRATKLKGKELSSSAMYDCKVFNYSLPSKCIDKLLNIIAASRLLLAQQKAFYDSISFVVWHKLKFVFCSFVRERPVSCKTSSNLLKEIEAPRRQLAAQRQQHWRIIVNYKVIFLFVSVSLLIHSFWLLYTQICCKAVKTHNRLRMKYFVRFEEALNCCRLPHKSLIQ